MVDDFAGAKIEKQKKDDVGARLFTFFKMLKFAPTQKTGLSRYLPHTCSKYTVNIRLLETKKASSNVLALNFVFFNIDEKTLYYYLTIPT